MMAARRVSNETKKLRNTYERNKHSDAFIGERVRLTKTIDPPADLDADATREWSVHMSLLLATGAAGPSDLRSFVALVQAAVLVDRAYKQALKDGPLTTTDGGSDKLSPSWTAWAAASGVYYRWARAFSLVPSAAMPALPMPRGGKPELVA
jgi:hypothetical protein